MHFKHPGWERARCTPSFCEMNGWHQHQHTMGVCLHSVFPKWFCMSPNTQWLERLRRHMPLRKTQPAWGGLEKDLCAPSGLPYCDGWPMECWSISSPKLIPRYNALFPPNYIYFSINGMSEFLSKCFAVKKPYDRKMVFILSKRKKKQHKWFSDLLKATHNSEETVMRPLPQWPHDCNTRVQPAREERGAI